MEILKQKHSCAKICVMPTMGDTYLIASTEILSTPINITRQRDALTHCQSLSLASDTNRSLRIPTVSFSKG